jgi:hypothetical protein
MRVIANETPDQKEYKLPAEEDCQIKLEILGSTYRSQAMRNLSDVVWLSRLAQAEMSSLIIPPPIHPIPFTVPSFGPDDAHEATNLPPEKCRESFGSISEVSYDAIPLIEKGIQDAQKNVNAIAFPWSPPPLPIRFLEIRGVNTQGVSGSTMDVFVYANKQPFTERLRISLGTAVTIYAFNPSSDKPVFFPFLGDTESSYLVAIWYIPIDGQILQPQAIGSQRLALGDVVGVLSLNWFDFRPTMSIMEQLETVGKVFKSRITFNIAITDQSDPARTVRLTASDPLFPSPLLTVYDLCIESPAGATFAKGDRFCMTFSLSRTTMNANQKLETKTVPAYVDPMANEPSSTGTTASVTVDSNGMQRIYFPEPLHFLLDPTPHEGMSIQFDVSKQQQPPKKGPLWKVMSVSANFEKWSEMHNACAPMKLTSTKAENATIKFWDLFPVVVAPTANLHNALIKTELDPTTTAKMYPPLVSYFVERRLSNQMLTMTNLKRLFDLVITADERFGLWIQHYFTPEPGCAAAFLRLLIENLKVIEEYPMHFFSLVFKSMRFEQAKLGDAFDFGPLSLLFTAVATTPLKDRAKILKSSGDFLLQLRMSCPTARFHRIAYGFLIQLSEVERLEIYCFLLSDIFFVRSITLLPSFSLSRPMSAFIPLLSLLYTTINTVFIQNKQDQIRKAAQTLSFLTSTLEQYANGRMAYEISRSLFPLLQQIFTFYDSLRDKLEKDMSPFGPIILFLLRNCDTRQFVLYFGILPPDNQLKFFEFLTGLSEGDMISAIATATNLSKLNVTYEITCRVLRCVTFVSKRLILEDSKGHLENFFKLLTHLLCEIGRAHV